MSHLTFFTYEGFGSKALESHAYNQAVRMDNQIWISGQGQIYHIPSQHTNMHVATGSRYS